MMKMAIRKTWTMVCLCAYVSLYAAACECSKFNCTFSHIYLDELNDAIEAFERKLQEPINENAELMDKTESESGDVLRLRGGSGRGKRQNSGSVGRKSSRLTKRAKIEYDIINEGESSSVESGYESSSAYSGSGIADEDSQNDDDDSVVFSDGVVKMEVDDLTGENELNKRDYIEGDEGEDASDNPLNLFNIRAKFMKLAKELQLPGNPLDTLIDQLGNFNVFF